jgi:hypothetical protein
MLWNLQNIRGQRDTVKTKIDAEKNIPASVKDFIKAQVDSLPPDVTGCMIEAYCQESENRQAMTVKRITQLVVTGVKL